MFVLNITPLALPTGSVKNMSWKTKRLPNKEVYDAVRFVRLSNFIFTALFSFNFKLNCRKKLRKKKVLLFFLETHKF